MMLRAKPRNRRINVGGVALLCACTTALTGFSDSESLQNKESEGAGSVDAPAEQANTASALQNSTQSNASEPHSTASELLQVDFGYPEFNDFRIRRKPVSYADNTMLSSVVSDLDSGLWLPSMSSEGLSGELKAQPVYIGDFRGVGFPDIRTYKRAKRSPFDPPGLWAPLVAWRDLQGDQIGSEPIARVRCMGLSPQAVAQRADLYLDTIYHLADRYDVDPRLIKAVIAEESCFDDKALSVVGAQGLMQLMPETATWLKVSDPLDAQQNLKGGVSYLASLQKQFGSIELVLAAYNAGPGNVRRYDGIPPFAETQAYVRKVQANYRRYEAAHRMLNPFDESELDVGSIEFQ